MPLNKAQVFNAREFDQALADCIAANNRAPRVDAPTLALFRHALKHGRATLKEHYYQDTKAPEIIATHAWLVDQLLTRAWQHHRPLLNSKINIALVAVGGYGRGELYPASDVDLMLLLAKDQHDELRDFAQALLNFFWDMGLEVGHSVRSVKDCVNESKNDITVATNLMEARLLVGDPTLFATMQKKTHATSIWPSKKFFAAKWQEQIERHHHFDDTAYNLEPNIKEGPGGLRDIQMIAWVTQRHFHATALHDLVQLEFLSEPEYRALMRGHHLLAQIRCGLHYLADHREDRLLFDYQRSLAKDMHYEDRPGSLAVEQFMKNYYRHVKELALLNEILLQHFQEAILAPDKSKVTAINRRFQARDNFLEVSNHRVFERASYALLEMFLILQQHPRLKGVRAQTIRLLRANLHRMDNKFRQDIACRSLFMEILRQPRGITHELRRMNAYGVLGAYIPAFGRIVGQMQHDLFHVYTVDEHSLFVVRNLRRFTVAEYAKEFPLASDIIARLVKPERLTLAGLFHDIAKGRGGDHSVLGEKDAQAFCKSHGLSDYDARFVAWLVRHHLVMSSTAQRHDIQDPEVVLRFAQLVGDQAHLDNLYLLTVADMRGTSPKVWNSWKDRLLTTLYNATARALEHGFGQPLDLEARINDLKNETRVLLKEKNVDPQLVQKHWERLEDDYFLRHTVETIAWHTQEIVSAALADLPLVATRYLAESGGTEVLVYTPDRDDLFVVLTGGFDRLNLSIVDARIHTTTFGFALDTFVILDHSNRPITTVQEVNRLRDDLRAQLINPKAGRDLNSAMLPRTLKHFPIKTRVGFDVAPSRLSTAMEVTASDRPGLLYQVALALQHCRIRLVTAKIATYGERAEDIFFITARDGTAQLTDEQRTCLETGIRERLDTTADSASDEITI